MNRDNILRLRKVLQESYDKGQITKKELKKDKKSLKIKKTNLK